MKAVRPDPRTAQKSSAEHKANPPEWAYNNPAIPLLLNASLNSNPYFKSERI